MNKITFNEKNIICEFDHGIESTIYFYNTENNKVLLKLLKDKIVFPYIFGSPYNKGDNTIYVSDETFQNKEKKIKLISEIDCLKNEVKPLDLVYNDEGKFIGYTMEYEQMKPTDSGDKTKNKLKVLHLLRDKIELLNKNNIYIGDINTRNILFDGENIKLCDLDNFRINDLDIDMKGLFCKTFEQSKKDPENLDNYLFNFFTYAYLYRYEFSSVYNNLRYYGLPFRMNTKENRELLNDLYSSKKTYEKRYFIDNLRY